MLKVEILKKENLLVLTLKENLTADDSDEFYDFVLNKLEHDPKDLEINISEIKFIDSSGLSCIINIFKKLEKKGLQFKIVGCNERMKKIFCLTKLDKIIPME